MLRLAFLLSLIAVAHLARILAVFPTPSISHQVTFRPVINELVNRGHEVVVITTDPQKIEAKNLTEIDLHDVSYKIWNHILATDVMGVEDTIIEQMYKVYSAVVTVFDEQLKNSDVKDILSMKRGKFDLLITEAVVRQALVFSLIYKVPLIQIGSLGPVSFNDHYMGALTHPLLYPLPWHKHIYNLTTWERISNLYNHYRFQFYYNYYIAAYENEVLKKHLGPGILPVNELCNNIDLLILNIHPLWIENQPVPPNVVFMNSIHLKPPKEVPKELKSYLDSSKNGVVYVSFGSNVIPSAIDKMQVLLKALSELPYDVLLKWDKEQLPIKAKNIRISKWLPQADLLRHPKIKVFITQGGLQSLDEAMAARVPLIGIPLFTDQWYNVDKFIRHNIGLRIDLEDLTEDILIKAVDTVIKDESYRENIKRLNRIMQDQPQPPLERAVWWIEHVLRHGGAAHLRARTANMPLPQFLQLDLVALALGAVVAVCFTVTCAMYLICKQLTKKKTIKIKIK
ncbi:UDP-glucosyltransferase 2-like [Aricia agestis]|uniref:UDP-glucosyltransferase 2-like n=1 Tax=Aricia agestis TaxID=91739 RepID=UPI001C20A187|nr:UDP-glucosyltransferase 2-like [Aricia agestis]